MIENLSLKNFKCFTNQSFRFSNLTLFTGLNATGKSTAIQSLLLPAQHAKGRPNSRFLPLNGELAELGSFGDVLSHHARDRVISMKFDGLGKELEFRLTSPQRSITLDIGSERAVLDNVAQVNYDSDFLDHSLFPIFENLIFISAQRLGTMETYPVPINPDRANADVGLCGQYATWLFEQSLDEEVLAERAHPKERALTVRRQLNAWCSELFPGFEANAVGLRDLPLVKLELRTSTTEPWKRPANIGYGLTYVFPIVVAGLLASKGQMLVIDNPEAHLHPRGQSRMGEFLAVIANSGVQVVLETHSDHVLNGIRLAVSKGQIQPDRVSVNFSGNVDGKGTPTILSPVLDRRGNLSEWPDNFFDQSEKDMASLLGWTDQT